MTAIPTGYITSVIGYNLKTGNYATPASTLPVQIALLGEPNTTVEPSVDETEPQLILTKKQMGEAAGYGSLPHIMFDYLQYLRVPIRWYPQKYDTGSAPTATVDTLTVTVTTATTRTTHNVVINGRKYPITVEVGDTQALINAKIVDVVNNTIDAPVIAAIATLDVTLTTKWKGKTSAGLKVRVDVGKEASGVSYGVVISAGTGTPTDISDSLARFGSLWNTIVINPYGEDAYSDLETFNGVADSDAPIGRWDPIVGLPFISLDGSNLSSASAIAAITDISARKGQMTNIPCSSPNAEWFPAECAASYALTYGTIANNTPHKGMCDRSLSISSPPYGGVGDMVDVAGRNTIAGYGHGTAEYVNGSYKVTDFISTYHPDGDLTPKFREARDIIVDMNILYYIKLIMARDIQGKVTTADTSITNVVDMISISDVKAIIESAIRDMAALGFIATPDLSVASMEVTLNPQYRFNIAFDYQRTSEVKQVGTDATVDFFTVI